MNTSRAAAVMRVAVLMAILEATCPHAGAATVYRCGNAYADVPCPRATLIAADDPRTAAQEAAAREVALREKALAARMESDRQRAEARSRPSVVRQAKSKTLAVPVSTSVRWTGRHRRLVQDNGQGDFIAFAPRATASSKKK